MKSYRFIVKSIAATNPPYEISDFFITKDTGEPLSDESKLRLEVLQALLEPCLQ